VLVFLNGGMMLFEMCLCLCKREVSHVQALHHARMMLFEMCLCLLKRES
jgi:hypothetical protein